MAPISSDTLSKLKSTFSDIVVLTPESSEFEESLHRWFRPAERNAGAIIYPQSVHDVADILRFAANHEIDIAVCGIGHNGKGNSVEDGLVIDLRKMSSVSVDPIKKTITTEAAVTWSSVYAEAEKHSLAAVGGITPSVGVGGFTLNGGYSWLNGAHGMGCDNLLEVEVVLGDGRIMNCSEHENQDMFWALRGAGSCFGIVTKFVLRAHDQKNMVWAGTLAFEKSQLSGVVDMANTIMSDENNDGKASLCMIWKVLPGTSELGIFAIVWYNGPEDEARKFFAPLLEMRSKINTAKMVPFSQSGVQAGSAIGRHWRKTSIGASVMAPLDFICLETILNDMDDFMKKIPDAEQSIIGFEWHNPSATLKVDQTGTAYADRGMHGTMFSVATWTEEENDEHCRNWCEKIDAFAMKEFQLRQREGGVDETTRTSTGRYPNYDFDGLDPREVYGVNHDRIFALKKKYDPGNWFAVQIEVTSRQQDKATEGTIHRSSRIRTFPKIAKEEVELQLRLQPFNSYFLCSLHHHDHDKSSSCSRRTQRRHCTLTILCEKFDFVQIHPSETAAPEYPYKRDSQRRPFHCAATQISAVQYEKSENIVVPQSSKHQNQAVDGQQSRQESQSSQRLAPAFLTMQPHHLLFSLLLLTPTMFAEAIPEPDFSPHAEELESAELEERQVAQGGGIAATTLAATQYPTTSVAGSLFTVDGTTSATWILMTQTFATTALGSWALGPTPGVGSIGLGSIAGTVGKVKSKRAIETAVPVLERDSNIIPGEMEIREG
ncbi:uncharacterized protein LY89DRAFT_745887 [Mollisia scopiformis]|uniref:FAD-binding PCMH-type domain-containing protein n=1 Tax=Mollisia scopiformis TaxID=149040 RepID=A0A194XCJ5_MOLSC|nr:uncharacterized protein LY89DRAFT_745887 [Mollisia scopiformis]KUJ17898.1 hypothetical protein LY89DRAFT_745887 [Mollisia scopiformis]